MKVLIVGGVAGGASAAARLRRLNESAEIIIFERGDFIAYANCGMPYHIGKVITQRSKLLIHTVEEMKNRFHIDVRIRNEVLNIDRDNKVITVLDHNTGQTYAESYDILILATGATPIRPRIPGINSEKIFTLRHLTDMDSIIQALDKKREGNAVIVGGGFIGIEMAENLHHRGYKISLVEMADQVMTNIDRDMAAFVHNHLRQKGVNLILRDGVKEFEDHGAEINVILQSGRRISADIVILAIGVRPETKLAQQAGLELGANGTIKVNSFFQTSDPSIYAVGDAIQTTDLITDKPTWLPLAGPANYQGRLAADNIAGREVSYSGVLGTAIAKVFDLTVASTGKNEKELQKEGIKYLVSYTHSNSHANYYPGATPLSIKLLFSSEGQILGAQIVGQEGVDKRIDVLATALKFKAKVQDLCALELAYAPPYSSAKDPVNIAGYVATNILNGDMEIIHWHQLGDIDPDKTIFLDVREPSELKQGFIPNSLNIPLGQLRQRLGELDRKKEIIVYCQIGLRGYLAARILKQKGFKVKNLSGGFKTWQAISQDLIMSIANPNSLEEIAVTT